MNDEPHDGLDSRLENELRADLGANASTVHVDADVTDVRRRLRHRQQARVSILGAAAVVAAVAVIAAWPGHTTQRLSLANTTPASPNSPSTTVQTATASGLSTGLSVTVLNMRTTADGLQITIGQLSGDVPSTPWWTAPASCRTPDQMAVSVTDPKTHHSGQSWVSTSVSNLPTPSDTVYVGASLSGLGEGSVSTSDTGGGSTTIPAASTLAVPVSSSPPARLVVPGPIADMVSITGTAVAHASVTFASGGTDDADEADATGGELVLGARDPNTNATPAIRRLDITLDNGKVLHLTDLDGSPRGYDLDGTELAEPTTPTTVPPPTSLPPECTAPPAPLPAAGAQPADAATAKAAVTAAIEGFYGTRDQATQATFVSDPAFAQSAFAELGSSGFAAAAGTAHATVDDLVFTSPTEAIVRYDVDLTPTGNEPIPIPSNFFHDTYGEAILVNGQWVLTPETVCKVLGQATPKASAAYNVAGYPTEVYGSNGSATKPSTK